MARKKKLARNVTMNGKLLYPDQYLSAVELQGKDWVLTIERVKIEGVQTDDGSADPKPVLFFKETKKRIIMNKTNAECISHMYGGEVTAWAGKRITVYPTKTSAFGEVVDCIRVRDKEPAPKAAAQAPPAPQDDGPPPGQTGDEFADEMAGLMSKS